MSNVTLDGNGKLIAIGILSHGHGTINNNVLTNIAYNQSGPDYKGMAIELYGSDMTVSNNVFTNIGRIGIYNGFGTNSTISGNAYVGKGIGTFLDYGFEVGRNGHATISNNTISNNKGVASDGSTSAGILVTSYYNPETPSGATITNNTISENTYGVALGYSDDDATSITQFNANTLSNNTYDLDNHTVNNVDARNNTWSVTDQNSLDQIEAKINHFCSDSTYVHGACNSDDYDTGFGIVRYKNIGSLTNLGWNRSSQSATPNEMPLDLVCTVDGIYNNENSVAQNWSVVSGANIRYQREVTFPNGSMAFFNPGSNNNFTPFSSFGAGDEGRWGTRVRAYVDANNNNVIDGGEETSDWSNLCNITYDKTTPIVNLVFPTPGSSATSFQAVFSENVNETEAVNPANYFLHNWPGAGGTGNLAGHANISYNSETYTATIVFTTPGWYISPEQEWGVQNIHDLAGNIQSTNPYSEYSTPMFAPSSPGTPSTSPDPTKSTTQNWIWIAAADNLGGSGVKGYHQRIYDVLGSIYFSDWSWIGNILSSTTNLSQGQWQLHLKAEDNAGNVGDESSGSITVDTTNPTGAWVIPADGATVSGIVALEVSASDETVGVKDVKFQYKRNDGADTFHDIGTDSGSPFTANWDTTGLALDAFTLKAIITDKAENSIEKTRTVNVAAVISDESSTTPTSFSAVISWTTDIPTKSRVVYDTVPHTLGDAPNYGYANSTGTFDTDPKVTSHSVTIDGLGADTIYYYRTISEGSPVAIGSERSFKTLSIAGASTSSGDGGGGGTIAGLSTIAPALAWTSPFGKKTVTLPGDEQVLGEETEATASPTPSVSAEETGVSGTFGNTVNGLLRSRTLGIVIGVLLLGLAAFFLFRKRSK